MVLTPSGFITRDVRDDNKKLIGVFAQETIVWDGTIATTPFPNTTANAGILAQALEGKPFRVKRMTVYGSIVTGAVNITPFYNYPETSTVAYADDTSQITDDKALRFDFDGVFKIDKRSYLTPFGYLAVTPAASDATTSYWWFEVI